MNRRPMNRARIEEPVRMLPAALQITDEDVDRMEQEATDRVLRFAAALDAQPGKHVTIPTI